MTAETPTKPSVRARTKRAGLREELATQSWRENAALFVFLAYVTIAPIPYGQITRKGELTLELFAFAALALLLITNPKTATHPARSSPPTPLPQPPCPAQTHLAPLHHSLFT